MSTAQWTRGVIGPVRHPQRALFATFALALVVRLLAQVLYGSYSEPDTWEYDVIARTMLAGEGYKYEFLGYEWLTFGFPAFPLLLLALHWIGGGPAAYGPILVTMAALSAAAAPLAYLIGKRLYGASAGMVAALMVTVEPTLVLFGARVHELNMDLVLLGGVTLALLDPLTSRRALLLGVLIGASSLARPTIFFFGVLGVLLVGLRTRQWRNLALCSSIAIAIALPWGVRNAIVLGSVTPTSPYNCVTLWMGNNPAATGGPLTASGVSVFQVMDPQLRARVQGKPEHEQGRAFCAEASAFLLADPVRAVEWWALKLAYFWWFPPHAGVFYPRGLIDLYKPVYAAQLALILLGVVAVWRRGSRTGLLIVGVELLAISAAQAIGYVEGRHRLVLQPTLLALAAAGTFPIVAALGRVRSSRSQPQPRE